VINAARGIGDGWTRQRLAPVVAAALLLAWMLAILPWLWLTQAAVVSGAALGIAALAILLGLVSVRTLMPAALILVFLSAEAVGVFGDHGGDDLPFVQLMAGVRITLRDGLLIAALPIAIWHLWQRREVPLFFGPFVLVLTAIAVGFALGVVIDGDVKAPLNALRPLFGYALYPILVAAVGSRRSLSWLVASLVAVAALSVAFQAVEVSRGGFLPFLAKPVAADQTLVGVSVDGRQVPYIWNRAVWHLFLSLFLALGCLIEWRGVWRYALVALVSAAGFAMMLTRSWYVFIGVGVAVALVAAADWSKRVRFIGVFGLGGLVLAVTAGAAVSFTGEHYGGSLFDVWLARTGSLLQFQQDPSVQARLFEFGRQWQVVLAAPILGYGLSSDAQQFTLQLGNLDTGAVNTLILFGFLGTAAFVGLVLYASWAAIGLTRRLSTSVERGYALGLLGVWAGVLVGYTFNYDFLTHPHGPWLIVLALSLQDRLTRLSDHGGGILRVHSGRQA
jgi:O-antigen ligase